LTLLVVMNYERHLLVRIPLQHSHFEEPHYCNSLLVGVADCVIRKLQGVQNAAARMITGTCKFDHVTPILRELHWLPVTQRIQDCDAGQQMSAGPSTPVSRWTLPAGRSSHRTSTPVVGRLRQTRHPTDSHSHWSQELRCFRSGVLEQFTSWTASVDTVHGHLCTTPESASQIFPWLNEVWVFVNWTVLMIIQPWFSA